MVCLSVPFRVAEKCVGNPYSDLCLCQKLLMALTWNNENNPNEILFGLSPLGSEGYLLCFSICTYSFHVGVTAVSSDYFLSSSLA